MSLTIPNTFSASTKAKASQVNANFAAVAAKFSAGAGGINDTDISSSADIDANKLSGTAGKKITSSKFEVGAVDGAALKKDATAGSPAAGVNDPTHIKDGIIGKAKIDLASKLAAAQLDLLVEETVIATGNIGASGLIVQAEIERRISGANYNFVVRTSDSTNHSATTTCAPTTPIPTATRFLVAMYLHNVFVSGSTHTWTLVVASIAKT